MKNLLLILSLLPLIVQGQVIATFAGNGMSGSAGDGGMATAAQLYGPNGLAFDAAGNTYITSYYGHTIRKVSSTGIISTFAGTGVSGTGGDGGPATAAQFMSPLKMVYDAAGNLYVSDLYGCNVRKITPAGIISTFAGTGLTTYNGDGIPATAANLHHVTGICIDHSGNLYVSDYTNSRIRKITPSGIISTVAGTGVPGFSGDGGPATAAQINLVWGIAVDASDNLYIADATNNRVRKISTSGIITTIAGTGAPAYGGDGGPATAAQLNNPADILIDPTGNIFIADQSNHRIRKISPSGIITTIVGTGFPGYSGDGGAPTLAQIDASNEIKLSPSGVLYICDNNNNRVRYITECAPPVAGSITGTTTICTELATTLSDAVAGGVWSSSTGTVATVSSSGVVTGMTPGTATISYTVTNSCGTAVATTVVTVSPTITPSLTVTVSPGTSVAYGATVTFSATTSGLISTPLYKWYINGVVIPGATNSVFTSSTLNNNDSVTCCVGGSQPCEMDTCFWVRMKVQKTGITDERAGLGSLVLLPNPNNGVFTIAGQYLNHAESLNLEISDVLGQIVYRKKLFVFGGRIEEQIHLNSDLVSGMYLVKVYNEGGGKIFHMKLNR